MLRKMIFFFSIAIYLFLSNRASAQVMAAKPVWITIKSSNLRCWECKYRLENYMNRENESNMDHALLNWNINLLAGTVRYQYLPDRVTPEEIRTAMNNAGFDADSTKAEPSAYNKLPLPCKYPEDGGGPKKNSPCHIEP